MLLFPIGFFYACFMVASKRIAAVAAQGKCSFPWDGIGLAHKRQLRFHRAVCKTAISPERCIIAPFILKGFGRCFVRERHAPSLQAPARLQVDGMRSSKAPSPDRRSVLPDRPESFPAFRHEYKDGAHALSGSALTSCVQGSFPGAGKSAASAPLWLSRCGDRQGWFSVGSWHHAPLQNKEPNNQYTVKVHVDADGDMVIIQNPTLAPAIEKSDYEPKTPEADASVDADTVNDATAFLETFFKLYPTATEKELAYYVSGNVIEPIGRDYLYSELVNPIFTKDGDNVKVKVAVKFLDNQTKATQVSQYELVLHKDSNWKIVG